jgi:hypothetical protein
VQRMFSLAYPSGPAPMGNAGAFRQFVLGQLKAGNRE